MALCIGLAKVEGYLLRHGRRVSNGMNAEWVLPDARVYSGFERLLDDTQDFIERETVRLRKLRQDQGRKEPAYR